MVSQATLAAGGKAHGIVPKALTVRAAEHTPAPAASASGSTTPASAQKTGVVASTEGAGSDLLDDDYDGRFTMEVCGSMHEVSCAEYMISNEP